MTSIEAIVQQALLSALQRHSKSLYGSALMVPGVIPPRGEYAKISGHFALVDISSDIAAAVEASLPKPCSCPPKD